MVDTEKENAVTVFVRVLFENTVFYVLCRRMLTSRAGTLWRKYFAFS